MPHGNTLAGIHSVDLSLLTSLSDKVATATLATLPEGSTKAFHMTFLIPLTFTLRVECTFTKPDGSETRIDKYFDLLDVFGIVNKP